VLAPERLAALPSARSARREEPGRLSVAVGELHLALPALLAELAAAGQGIELESLSTRPATLEDVFVKLTGRRLRDGEAGS
jgi:hypothetical protein